MTWKRQQNGLLAKVNFPPYTLQMLTSRHVLIGGGGGPSNTGVANGFEVFEIFHDGTQFVAERNTRYETGPNVVMNSAVHNDGKKMWLAAGQESHCQIYNIQASVVAVENGKIAGMNDTVNGEIRQRRKNDKKDDVLKESIEEVNDGILKEKHEKLRLQFQPLHSTQTDFGISPLQRVVRLSPDGKLMATGGTDGCIRLWHFPKGTPFHELKSHEKEIDDIDFCPENKQLATVAKDGKLLIWDVSSGSKIKDLVWNPPENQKYIFKRCRFRKPVADNPENPLQLYTISNSLPSNKKIRDKGYLQLWNVEQGTIEKVVAYQETLSELAVSDDGKFLAVGTMFSGSVDMFIAFSLNKVLHVPSAHNMFVTSLIFLPKENDKLDKLDGPAVTSNSEAAVISCSVDNKICIHNIPYRRSLPLWVLLLLIILCICIAFILCSYLGI